ncbi:putative RNA-binding Zn ribbon-like protein [Arthrobacter pigmenti]|uniref:Putative RNA-binding Zn ribbon-like protein n=1 Tax=Arthrobacter pigmenti TaxID=271432 RepID=A0A846RJ20_9MICC|nr:CGNR zinc finger domain-containing protein [Arthrobacter pigmenti]NJC23298.1 putative RNA-binding Zn ribbon-like protein [Arthrobacter pigmenti]
MHLNPYGEYAVLLAASLANAWPDNRAGVVTRARDFGMTMQFPEGPEDHEHTRQVIDEWLRVVDTSIPDARAELLNAQMAEATAYPRLTDHDNEGWHLHYRDDGQGLPAVLRAVISVGTSLHLVTRGMHRVSRCEAAPCRQVVVDVTRNGRQRYCSVRCGNRAAVRRHRAQSTKH